MPDRIPADWPEVRLVRTGTELKAALAAWRAAGVIGVDTESNSFYAYTDRLCLFQVTADGEDWLADPLALGDELRAARELLEDSAVTKVFHAAEFDLMLLKKDLGAEVRGLFDTQVAMTLLGHEKTGLAALIRSYYGLELSKKEQRSDWGRRPLTEAQIAYARIDTHFLPDLYRRLRAELEEKGLAEAARGEFARLEREILPPRRIDPDGWRRLKGARALDPTAAARLRELFRWRERTAEALDKPVFRILANETLVDLAARPPRDLKDLAGRKGVGWGKARRIGAELLSALAAAAGQQAHDHIPEKVSREERRRRRARREIQDALRRWRKERAEELGLPSERLMHRRHLEEIGRRLPRTRQELAAVVDLNDWQRENLEDSLLELLASLPEPESEPENQ
ncbi:MAG: ribonuclease D [Planctomycetota bacterium]|nr:MAG: ribonuclease D [Planctomycetota bacterium]